MAGSGSSDGIDDLVVVVSGVPGSGKTTLARGLAHELPAALLSKDTVKESLFDALGSGDLEWSRRLGRAAHRVMYSLVDDLGPVVLDAFFWPGEAEADLMALGRPLIQVRCDCPVEIAVARYRQRRHDPHRHPGHRPEHQDDLAISDWAESDPRPLGLPAPLIDVDTTAPVDIASLSDRIRSSLAL